MVIIKTSNGTKQGFDIGYRCVISVDFLYGINFPASVICDKIRKKKKRGLGKEIKEK